MGTPAEGDAFLSTRWPEARAVSDPERALYDAFGLRRASAGEVLSPRSWGSGLKAVLSGHLPGRPVGDPLVLSGQFLVRGGEVLWENRHAHPGDERRHDELLDVFRALP